MPPAGAAADHICTCPRAAVKARRASDREKRLARQKPPRILPEPPPPHWHIWILEPRGKAWLLKDSTTLTRAAAHKRAARMQPDPDRRMLTACRFGVRCPMPPRPTERQLERQLAEQGEKP